LQTDSIWVKSRQQSDDETRDPTVFAHMKTVWFLAYRAASETQGTTLAAWKEDGQSFEFSAKGHGMHLVQISAMKSLTLDLLSQLTIALDELLPEGVDLSELSLNGLNDDPLSRNSFFDSPKGKEIFSSPSQRVHEALWTPGNKKHNLVTFRGKLLRKNVKVWLAKEQQVMGLILTIFYLASGIPPRAFQAAELLYRPESELASRNLLFISDLLVIAFPRAKQLNRTRQPSLWSLPPALLRPLCIYLGVFRPITNTLMKKLGRDTTLHNTRIFAFSGDAERSSFYSQDVNQFLRTHTRKGIGFPVDAGSLRQIMTIIFRKHLPHLIELPTRLGTSYADRAAGHNSHTSKGHYGIEKHCHSPSLKMSAHEIDRFVLVSQTWQAVFGLVSVDNREVMVFEEAVIEEHRRIGLDHARWLINKHYGIGEQTVIPAKQIVKQVLDKLPFLYGDGVCESLRI
jgi:hypothetical protein